MKVINTGRNFSITDDSLKTYDQLPTGVYTVRFSQFKGFYLELHAPMEVKEEKIYGVHQVKVDKVLRSFKAFNRNLGVILSGDKGIGKSMFARLLSIEANKKDIPLIIVEEYVPGIASFIEDIQQEVVVLFDEFEKTFAGTSDNDPQASMLSLFDGVAQGKKLFVITCNEIKQLNDYLINRPGRFHYHFRFDYPSAEEIKQYLTDKLDVVYHNEINNVISFSRKVNLNYDCLRAISFELNSGIKFEEAIKDLNIVNVTRERYNIQLHFINGLPQERQSVVLDLFSDNRRVAINLNDEKGLDIITVEFNPTDAKYDSVLMSMIVPKEKIKLKYEDDLDYYKKEDIERNKALIPDYLLISREKPKSIHYMI